MNKWMSTWYGSLLKLLVTAILPLIVLCTGKGNDIFTCVATEWKAYATAGILSLMWVVYNYNNPEDKRYGNGAGDDTVG